MQELMLTMVVVSNLDTVPEQTLGASVQACRVPHPLPTLRHAASCADSGLDCAMRSLILPLFSSARLRRKRRSMHVVYSVQSPPNSAPRVDRGWPKLVKRNKSPSRGHHSNFHDGEGSSSQDHFAATTLVWVPSRRLNPQRLREASHSVALGEAFTHPSIPPTVTSTRIRATARQVTATQRETFHKPGMAEHALFYPGTMQIACNAQHGVVAPGSGRWRAIFLSESAAHPHLSPKYIGPV
ncbi:hypothetical protein B0T14DRAFT_148014 [Immersiella caudata]|uniref:Uncharacterized protein n=1 Tax=Immersiella caudata TaxID=314043 RepID=A0AA40C2E8_9PEZI|nr:hypothetical protein B0T14DRAFT_148014 [Immersiella caudata]